MSMKYLKLKYFKYLILIIFLYILLSIFIRLVNIYSLLLVILIIYIFYNIDKKLFKKIVYKVFYKNKKNLLLSKNTPSYLLCQDFVLKTQLLWLQIDHSTGLVQ